GGEQQMLAISRALLTNPHLLIMDEPTEGLAPIIVTQVEEMLVQLGEDGDISVLVIEQNIGVATAVARNVAVMVNGRINRVIRSGGEQQMLAISRALLTNPHLLIMDEPTEGLAPIIVTQVEEMLVQLGEDGDISVLVIEQNIGVATAVARNVAVMVNGRINRVIDS